MTMIRKLVPSSVTVLGEDEVEVRMSTATLARDGHILIPQGARLDSYKKNPVFLWNHDVDGFPVGRSEQIQIDGEEIVARVRFPPLGISARADECRGLTKAGFINGVSVGFDPLDGEPLDPKNPRGGQRFTDWDMIECSFCCVPVDTDALVTARSIEIPNPSQEQASMADKDKNDRSVKSKHTRALASTSSATILKRGLNQVASLAYMLESFGYAHSSAEWEAEVEGDESPVPGMLGEALVKFGQAFIAMSKEEVTELLAGKDLEIDEDEIPEPERAYVAAGATPAVRAWRSGIAIGRAGKAVSASNEKKLSQALDHHARAMKHHKSLGEHNAAVGGHLDAITEQQSKSSEAHGELGEALHAIKNEPEKATEHVARALKQHKAIGAQLDDMAASAADAKDRQQDAGDSHDALGRCLKSATRCVRGVVDGATPDSEDGDSKEVQTSAGTGESGGSKDERSLDLKRRSMDLEALVATARSYG